MKFLLALNLSLILPVLCHAEELESIARGKYLYEAADCRGCHGNSRNTSPSGGRALETPFGTFYAPNISGDNKNGIGPWSEQDFVNAVRKGVGPGGKQLFPVFPYTSYSGMTDQDIKDIRKYILTLPVSSDENKNHNVKFPFGFRPLMALWKMFFFKQGPLGSDIDKSPEWNRGRYLVQAVVHCTECHSPRSRWTGVVDHSSELSGNIGGPDGMNAPNITPDKETGIGLWTVDEIAKLLKTGETPDYELVSSGMTSVVRGTRMLTDDDRRAIAIYLKTLPAIHTKKIPLSKK